MTDVLNLLAENALLLVCGTSLLLALGCAAVWLCKSPVHRQRIAELTIAGVLGWMVLALFPLPRLLPDNFWGANPPAVVPVQPGLPIALEAAWPIESDSGTLLPVIEIPNTELVVLPEVIGLVQEAGSDDDFQKADGLGNPSYGPSPSEELSRLAAEVYLPRTKEAESEGKSVSSSFAWQLDLTKLAGLFTGVYLAGASLCLLWIVAGHLLLLRIRQTAAAPPEWLAKQYQALAKQSGIAGPQLIISPLCSRPLTWGVLWPVVVLPRSLCRQENKSQLETILLHELGHIAQHDSHGNLLFCIALPLLYAHPLFWWLRRESQLAAELVADDWAAWQTGKETYVEELVALARCTGKSSLPLVSVTGLFSSPSLFYRRMQMLLAREKPLSTKTSLPWRLASLSALAGAVVLAASLAGVRPVAGQTDPPTTTPPAADPVPTTPPAIAPPSATPYALPDAVPAPPTAPKLDTRPAATPPLTAPFAVPPPIRLPTAAIPGEQSAPPSKEEADLLAEIRQLQEKLRSLQGKGRTSKNQIAQQPGGKTVTLVREDGNGVQWTEIWSTDPKGEPDRLISKSERTIEQHRTVKSSDGKFIYEELTEPDGSRSIQVVDSATGKIIGKSRVASKQSRTGRIAVNNDGKTITEEFVEKDGSRRTVVIDAVTGKVITESRRGAADPESRYAVVPESTGPTDSRPAEAKRSELRFPTPIVPGTTAFAPPSVRSTAPSTAEPNMARGSQQLDLVSLATSYADAVSEVELAEAKMADIAKLGDSNAISNQEVTAAKLALSAAKRKEQLLRSIAEVATESAAQEFERTSQLHKTGVITASEAGDAKIRMEILKQILRTRPAETEPKKQ
jgi:beta-lactamase regulating signal transducer with metallopeptidase domain